MHAYATDSHERVRVIAVLVVLSLLAGQLSESLFSLPGWSGFLVDLSAVGWFGLFFWLVNNYLWKWRLLQWMKLFHLPNLHGVWSGDLFTSYDDMLTPMPCNMTISQTWTSINVQFQTERMRKRSSKSVSKAASLLIDQDGSTVLRYEYHNEPDAHRKEELDIHWGTARIEVVEVGGLRQLQGSYYTNRKPQTYGAYTLHKSM